MLKISKKVFQPKNLKIVLFAICGLTLLLNFLAYSDEWSVPEKLPEIINLAPDSNESPFIYVSPEGREFLYFSSNGPPNLSSYYDLLVSEKINGVWQGRENLWTLNSHYRDQCPSLTADGNEIYFHSERPTESDCNIWVSKKDTLGNWTTPEKVNNINSQYVEIGPSISADGLTLYFSSNRPESLGHHDIYVTKRESRFSPWSAPENIVEINTIEYDDYPSISSDNLTLYFDRRMPNGYKDIYVTKRPTVDSPWEEPKNLGPIVNTEYDETRPSISPDSKTLYFASGRKNPCSIWVTHLIEAITALIDIDPDTLNLRSKGKWITAYIELPEEYDVNDIDIGTVKLQYNDSSVEADWGDVQGTVFMVKFDRNTVSTVLSEVSGDVELIVTGEVDSSKFEGTDTIKVINKGKK